MRRPSTALYITSHHDDTLLLLLMCDPDKSVYFDPNHNLFPLSCYKFQCPHIPNEPLVLSVTA